MTTDRWAAYNDLVARAAALPPNLSRTSLERLAEISRPVADAEGAPRYRVQPFRTVLPERVRPIPYNVTTGLIDADRRPVKDVVPLVYDLSGGTIFANGNVLCDDALAVDEFRCVIPRWRDYGCFGMHVDAIGLRDFDHRDNTALLRAPPKQPIETLPDSDIYFLFHTTYSHGNFGHFLHDSLAQLQIYRQLCQQHGVRLKPLITHSDRPHGQPFKFPMQHLLWERLIGPLGDSEVLNPATRPAVRVERCFSSSFMLYLPDSAEVSVGPFRYLHAELSALYWRLPADGAKPATKIYLSRGDAATADRRFHNLEACEAMIAAAGYETIVPTRWSPAALIQILSGARSIVGVHGAGLTNMLFAPEGARVIELLDYPSSWQSLSVASAAVGFDHHRVHALRGSDATAGVPGFNLERLATLL